jgi:hypothetical protein
MGICLVICVGSLALQMCANPYGTAAANRHDTVLLAVQLLTVIVGGT